MSYHRGGHSGAVAVSYSTMSPLSPIRRYSGSAGNSTSVTSATNGTSSSAYSNYRSTTPSNPGNERNGGYYTSPSNVGHRSSSFSLSRPPDTLRRVSYSPARSVSSYNETSSISGSGLRYGSVSSSSASSSAGSSSSSCTSRERSALQNHSAASLATTAADFYALYSPSNYIPNISGSSKSSSTNASSSNWKSSSLASASGVSSSLHGGDEYDSCRDRRERSYSSETSSSLALASNNQNSSAATNNDRWKTRRNGSVAANRFVSSSATGSNNVNNSEIGSARIEVTINPEESTARRALDYEKNEAILNSTDLDFNPQTFVSKPRNNDFRDLDNNNAQSECSLSIESINSNDRVANQQCNSLETRRRRKRVNFTEETIFIVSTDNYQPLHLRHDEHEIPDDHDPNTRPNHSETVELYNLDNSDDSFLRENAIFSADTRDRVKDHHHQRKRQVEQTSDPRNSKNDKTIEESLDLEASSLKNSPSSTFTNENLEPESPSLKNLETIDKIENLIISHDSEVGQAGGGGDCRAPARFIVVVDDNSADAADNHRKAFTRTKIPTNNDNTELLTNNNVQDREDHLEIVENIKRHAHSIPTVEFVHENTKTQDAPMLKQAARKSLIWTATEACDDDDDDEGLSKKEPKTFFTNGDDSRTGNSNGFHQTNNHDDQNDSPRSDSDQHLSGASFGASNGLGSAGNHADDVDKAASTSRRTIIIIDDDLTGASSSSSSSSSSSAAASSSSSSSSAAATSSSNATNSVPVAVHQNIYRGINDQIDENSRPPRNRLQFRKDERYGLNGLRNIGNTCFMNSVIQCLSNTRPLLEYLLNEQHLQDINTTTSSMKGALIKAFGQVIQELWEMSGDHVVNTTSLKSQIQRFAPRFMGYSQQDAQEFLRYLLEGLHEDVNRVTIKPQPILTDIPDHYSDSHKASESWKRYLRSEDSTIVDVFVGQLRSSLLCTACDHSSVTLDPFWDLSLPIPMRLGTVKLNQCLEHFTKVETLDGDEKPTCSKCQMRRKCTKSFSIQKFPKILVIHLKRFSPTERFRGKLSVLVDFPLTGLDLSAFAAPGVQGCTYNLYGVANHSGTTYSGHYTAYCKHPYSGEWHEYNDSRVSSVPARSVVSSEAYVLFYEQQPPSPHL